VVLLAETPTQRLSVGLDSGNRGSACVRLYLSEVFAAAVDPAICNAETGSSRLHQRVETA
jgi:hypothetical protein